MTPWKLWKGITSHKRAILFHAEAILLRVASVKHIVTTQQKAEQEDGVRQRVSDRSAVSKLIVDQVNGCIAVGKRNTSHVPENEHETCLPLD